MVDVVSSEAGIPRPDHPLNRSGGAKWFLPAFGVLVLVGVIYVGYALSQDLAVAKTVPWILLGIALLIALGFERLARRAVGDDDVFAVEEAIRAGREGRVGRGIA